MEHHHIIKRQVLDIGLGSDVGSFLFQDVLRDVYYAEIIPVLEQCCNKVDDVSKVYKINKLEIDLGTIDQNNLVEDFKSKVRKQFYDSLLQAIRNMPLKEETDLRDKLALESGAYPGTTEEDSSVHYEADANESELELLSHFLKTGRLPWWSRKEEKPDISAVIDNILQRADTQFIKLVEDLIAIPDVLTRLIYQFSDKQLERTVEILSKRNQEVLNRQVNKILNRLNHSAVAKDTSEHTIRNEVWQAVFLILKAEPLRDFDEERLHDQLINRLPGHYRHELNLIRNADQKPGVSAQVENSISERIPNQVSAFQDALDDDYLIALADKEPGLMRIFTAISTVLRDEKAHSVIAERDIKLFQAAGDALFELLDIIKTIKTGDASLQEVLGRNGQQQIQTKHRLIAIVSLFRERLALLSSWIQSSIREDVFSEHVAQNGLLKPVQDSLKNLFEDLLPSRKKRTKSYSVDLPTKDTDHNLHDPKTSPQVKRDSDQILHDPKTSPRVKKDTDPISQEPEFLRENKKRKHPYSKDSEMSPKETDDNLFDGNREDAEAQEIVRSVSKKHSDLFAESEEFYITNSGLVLFWPYLGRFFESVGCLKKNAFINTTIQEKAVLNLQYLAEGHQEYNEYDLPLNKLLCGLGPNYPIPTALHLQDDQIEEADTLIITLIHHWSVLKNMSPAGFRQLFINREGMITRRNGNYVLRVEEQACDVLIDKLPWQITTIKLPWMDNLIFVEWRL